MQQCFKRAEKSDRYDELSQMNDTSGRPAGAEKVVHSR